MLRLQILVTLVSIRVHPRLDLAPILNILDLLVEDLSGDYEWRLDLPRYSSDTGENDSYDECVQ